MTRRVTGPGMGAARPPMRASSIWRTPTTSSAVVVTNTSAAVRRKGLVSGTSRTANPAAVAHAKMHRRMTPARALPDSGVV